MWLRIVRITNWWWLCLPTAVLSLFMSTTPSGLKTLLLACHSIFGDNRRLEGVLTSRTLELLLPCPRDFILLLVERMIHFCLISMHLSPLWVLHGRVVPGSMHDSNLMIMANNVLLLLLLLRVEDQMWSPLQLLLYHISLFSVSLLMPLPLSWYRLSSRFGYRGNSSSWH